MRSLLVLILLAALAGGAFLSRPDIEAHRKHADTVLAEMRKDKPDGDAIGDLIGAMFDNRNDTFEDMMVATKLTTRKGEDVLLECMGLFSQFFCSTPEAKS
jgi:hypothetical protein